MAVGMELPSPNDYLAAVQNPRNCFADATLASGQTVQTSLGLPKVASGNFAVVFQLLAGQARYAVKCFTRRSDGQQRRYSAIAKHLQERKLPYFVEFAYLQQGIRVRGAFHPIVKMEWAVGKLLHLFVEENLRRPAVLTDVAERWRRLVADLAAARISHGDLQHRNVIVQGGKILLIDYDGMYVPTLRGEVGTEAGHEHFQHPQRTSADFGEGRDSFASIVIYLSLRAIAADHSLWREFHLGENLIFSKTDYQRSGQTRVWGRLAQSSDEIVRRLALQLQAYCRSPVRHVPTLEQALSGQVPPTGVVVGPSAGAGSARVDYGRLERALGVAPPQNTPPGAPAQAPAPRPSSGAARPPAVDWQLLRRLEEAQRAARSQRPAQAPPPAQTPRQEQAPLPTRVPRLAPTPKPPPSSQAKRTPRAQPIRPRKAPAPSGQAPDARRPTGAVEAFERAIGRLFRFLFGLLMLAAIAGAVLLVVVYFAATSVAASPPAVPDWLGAIVQMVRDWTNTVIPAAGQVISGASGPQPG